MQAKMAYHNSYLNISVVAFPLQVPILLVTGLQEQPPPHLHEMCWTNGARNYTEIGHTGCISKSPRKGLGSQIGVKGLRAHLFPKQKILTPFELPTLEHTLNDPF